MELFHSIFYSVWLSSSWDELIPLQEIFSKIRDELAPKKWSNEFVPLRRRLLLARTPLSLPSALQRRRPPLGLCPPFADEVAAKRLRARGLCGVAAGALLACGAA
jgi:hypothetical protein